jgi:putative DNA primase/helicase
MSVISQGRTEEELEKRLGAALLAGDTAITLDNCEQPLQSSFLCQALTQQKLNIRVLGASKNVETPVNATIFATGNNLTIVGDLTRRTLVCSLDAHCERPELRIFRGNLLETLRAQRGQLVAAALTVLRAWHVSGESVDVSPFGSFDSWSHRVREPLVWLGRADPCETVIKVREDDPKRAALLAVLIQWREAIGLNVARTVREIINIAVTHPDFLASYRSATVVSNDRLGRWLAQNEGKIAAGFSLVRAGNTHGYPLWQLIEA